MPDCQVTIRTVRSKTELDPRLYKVSDNFFLSLSRALASCSCFQLCSFVTERQILYWKSFFKLRVVDLLSSLYYILRADMYLHCFVV